MLLFGELMGKNCTTHPTEPDPSEFGLYVYDFGKQKEEEIILDGEPMGRLHVSSVSMRREYDTVLWGAKGVEVG